MEFASTQLPGVILIRRKPIVDSRGYFERFFCEQELNSFGINFSPVQTNFSNNTTKGTLRGLHFQIDPKPEAKIVWCEKGRIFDVAVDIRKGSPTFGKWISFDLCEEDHQMVFIPAGFAHGFQTLENNSKVGYLMSDFYVPELARGVRWNDPQLAIPWPLADPFVSERDAIHPLLTDLK